MTTERLDEIRQRWNVRRALTGKQVYTRYCLDIPDLLAEVERLEKELAAYQPKEIVVDDVDDAQARARILKVFEHAGVQPLFHDIIADQTNLPLPHVVKICDQLEAEGIIGEPARTMENHQKIWE